MSSLAEKIAGIKRSLFNNPILIKELRLGLREKKVFITQTVYMLVLGVISFIFLLEFTRNTGYYFRIEAGRNFFKTLCIFQWILIVLISPSLTSTSISSEKEKKTYDMLLVTLLSAPEIIIGKLNYAASYLILLLASSLPLVALVFLIGGVTPFEIFINYVLLLAWGIMVSMLAMFFSSREHRSSVATSQSYGAVILFGVLMSGFYLHYFWETGQFIGYSLKFPEMLAWLTVYFNIIWAFLFLFYKTANNIRPRARTIISIHRLFIFGFLLNSIGLMAIMAVGAGSAAGTSGMSIISGMGDSEISVMWLLFSMSAIFFMGCFLEKQQFTSKQERSVMSRSLTSKSMFFPAYFTFSGMVIALTFSFVYNDMFKIWTSFFMFAFIMWILVLITGDIVKILKNRVRPVFIYYPMLLVINLIPLISWVVVQSTSPTNKALSIFSLIFIQPVFSILSIWKTVEEFAMVSVMPGLKVPTFFLTVIFYLCLYLFVKIVGMIVGSKKNNGTTGNDKIKKELPNA